MDAALSLSTLDYAIIAIYFFVVLSIGLWIGRKTKGGEDLFLAGRSLGWVSIGFSLFASNISSTTLIGLVGAAYATGLSVSNYEWMATVVLVFMCFTFIPVFLRARISTTPEFLERRFDGRSRTYFAGLTIITNLFVDTAGSLYAGAVVLKLFFPDLDLFWTCIVLAVVAGLYTAAGGLAAVVYTDTIQAVVLLVGAVLLTYYVFAHPAIDFSWTTVLEGINDPDKFSVIRPIDDATLPWLGTLVGVPLLGFYFWCTNQYIIQRVLGARSVYDARWGALLAGMLKLPILFIMVLPGLLALLIFPDICGADPSCANRDMVFPMLVTELLPVGVVGLVMAGLIAAIMSSIDSTLNSASALVTLDFIKVRRPNMTDQECARVGRIAMAIIMIIAALWAPQIANFEGLFDYLQQMLAYIVPPVVVLFLFGGFSRKGTGTAALATLIIGHTISLGVFVAQKLEIMPEVHFTIATGALTLVSAVVFVVASKYGVPKTDEELEGILVGAPPPPKPGLRDYRLHSAVLLALTTLLVIMFW